MKILCPNQFDILRGIGIILVMFGHAISKSGFAHNLIYGFSHAFVLYGAQNEAYKTIY